MTEVLSPPRPIAVRASSASLGTRSGLCVLVVDRDAESADRLAALLVRWGHEPHVAATGGRALELALAVAPRVALVDPSLPDRDGLQLARRLRRRTTFVAVMADTSGSRLRDCLCAGYLFHIAKPIDPRVLRPLLDGLGNPAAIEFAPPQRPAPVRARS